MEYSGVICTGFYYFYVNDDGDFFHHMAAKITKVFLKVAFLLLLLSLGLGWALGQPKWLAATALKVLNHFQQQDKGVVFKEITMDAVRWHSCNSLTLENLRLRFKAKGSTYFVSTGTVNVDDLQGLIGKTPLKVEVKNLAVVSDSLNISNVVAQGKIYFQQGRYQHMESQLQAAMLEWNESLSMAGVKGFVNLKQGWLVEADLEAHGGGHMKASLLQYLAQYMPQRQQIEDLINQGKDVDLTQAHFKVISLSNDKLSSQVLLKSAPLNLDMNVTFDINIK